jgi:putative heme-binding domain-containing protein
MNAGQPHNCPPNCAIKFLKMKFMMAKKNIIWLICMSLGFQAGLGAQDDPAAQLAAFKVADGYEVNLFASELEGIANPIQMRFDHEGRLYVACSWVYPQLAPGQGPNDKIILLQDTNGDGRADRSGVFADGLIIPTGLETGDGGVYVGNGTELLFLQDTTGDGKADVRRVVLRGFGTGDSHQNINSFTWGPGGELMMSQGLHAVSKVETPWGISYLDQAGIWRLRPRLLRLDGFFGGGMAPHNPWGFAFDKWGQLLVMAGNGHGIYDPLPVMIRNHKHLEHVQIWENMRGRKICGVEVIESSHFPEEMQGTMAAGGFMNHMIFGLQAAENGSSFKVRDLPPLLVSTHGSFRPVDVKLGPDGALYVADWYNPIIGHYQASFRHPDRDKTHGRIWRITAKDRPLLAPPKLSSMTVSELLEQLKSPEGWNRYQARRVLAAMETEGVVKGLENWISQLDAASPSYERWLVEAMGIYESHEVIESGLVEQLLRARDHRARAYAVGVIAHGHDRLPQALDWIGRAVEDEHPRVRLAAVVAAAAIPEARSMEIAAAAADRELDQPLEYALEQAVHVLKPHWIGPFTAGELTFGDRQNRLEFVLKADGSPDTFQALMRMLESGKLTRQTRSSFLHIVAEVGGPDDLAKLLEPQTYMINGVFDGQLQAKLLFALGRTERFRQARPSGDLGQAVKHLLDGAEERVQAELFRLIGIWKLPGFGAELKAAAESGAVRLRQAALEGLGHLGDEESRATLNALAGAGELAARAGAAAALAWADIPQAAGIAAQILADDPGGATASVLVPAFLQRKGGSEILAAALERKSPSEAAAREALQLIQGVGRTEEQLEVVLTRAAGRSRQVWEFTDGELEQFVAEVNSQGDPIRGQTIYQRAELGCVACHVVGNQGGSLGPDLNSIGSGQPVDFILGAVLEPNREVKEGYEAMEVTTRDGDTYQGYKVREDGSELVLRDLLQDQEIRIRKENIQERMQRGSIMPAGLVDSLDRTELRDLIRYLSGLGKPE